MIIAREMFNTFVDFVTGFYGATVTTQDKPTDEFARFMLNERLVVVRTHGLGMGSADTLEVFTSDRDKLNQLDARWSVYVQTIIEESEDAESSDRKDI